MPSLPRWFNESKRLRASGDETAANEVLLAAGKRGSLEAAATLARCLWSKPEVGNSLAILEEVERRVSADDWKTHFSIHLAYAVAAADNVEQFIEFRRRAFDHLKAAAKAGSDARMYYAVGLHYWQGLNSIPKDPERARAWLEAAASSGDAEMLRAFKKFTRKYPPRLASSAA